MASACLPSPRTREGFPFVAAVPSTNPLNVAISSPVRTLAVQSPEALSAGRLRVLSLQMEAAEDGAFAHEMRTTSVSSGESTASAAVSATVDIPSVFPPKQLVKRPAMAKAMKKKTGTRS